MCDIRKLLSGRIHKVDIELLSLKAEDDANLRQMLFSSLSDENSHVADNAAWVMTHFSEKAQLWLSDYQECLVNMVLLSNSATRKRLLLTMLEKCPFPQSSIRTDFLDFCLDNIISTLEPVGIRSLCTKLAYKQCRCFPELLGELILLLESLDNETLTPAMKSVRKRVLSLCARESS